MTEQLEVGWKLVGRIIYFSHERVGKTVGEFAVLRGEWYFCDKRNEPGLLSRATTETVSPGSLKKSGQEYISFVYKERIFSLNGTCVIETYLPPKFSLVLIGTIVVANSTMFLWEIPFVINFVYREENSANKNT